MFGIIEINILSVGIHKMITLDNIQLMVFESGDIYRKSFNKWKIINNTANHSLGYNKIGINGKEVYRHRIVAHTYLNLDINDIKKQVDHIDHNKLNNSVNNLRVVNNQQNQFNRIGKGYFFNKKRNKYIAQIGINGVSTYLGSFITKEEANAVYLAAKLIHHNIGIRE